MQSKMTDQEFIDMWTNLQSPAEMSRCTGLNVRGIYARRNRLEAKYGTLLTVSEIRNAKHDSVISNIILSARKDVNRLSIDSGMIVIGSDAHYSPGYVSVAHKAFCNIIAEYSKEIRAIILNGDIFDGGSISRHDRIRWKKSPSVKDELEAVQARLGEIESVRPAGAHLLRTYGNHCARFENRLSANVPEFEGIGGFLLKDHLPHWNDSERIDINDDCVVIHDWHSGVHSGWNDTLKGGCTVITGHTHELSAKAHKGFKDTHYGIKTGMLASGDQEEFDYRIGKPGFNWQSGFAVLTWVNGMLLYPEFCAVRDDGKAYFRGRLFAE